MFNTASTFFTSDQQANFYELQELLKKAKERVQYFFDIDLDIISEWVNKYKECSDQMNQDTQQFQYIQSTLQNLIRNIEIIKTEGMLLVGNFKPWMSGIGMISFPFGYTIYGKITFGILNGQGVIKKNQNNTIIIGNFNQNKLQGQGTIIFNNQYQINGLFDKGKIISGPIQIKMLNQQEKEIQAQLNIDSDLIELSNQQQFREKMNLNNFSFKQSDNIIYKAPQFVLGQKEQSSYTLYLNGVQQEYNNGILQNGIGQVITSNNIQLKGRFIDGALNGPGQLIDRNNNLLLEGEFYNNIMSQGKKYHLEPRILHEEGQFNEQTQLSGNGKRYFNIADLIKEEGRFVNGQLHGEGIKYYQIDEQQIKIMEKGNFQNGILILGTKFYQNGRIEEKGQFNSNGLQGEGERRHQNGYIKEYGIFLDGKLHSKDEKSGRANDNGLFIEIGYFLNGQLEGQGERYYPNGKKKEIGKFSNGQLNGDGKKYYDNQENSLEEEGLFQDGKLDSRILNISYQYYQDGSLKCYGMFSKGLLTTTDGTFYFNEYEMKGVFQNGQVNGTMRLYNSNNEGRFERNDIQSNEEFLRAANRAGVYQSTQFNINAQQSYKRI
ncbi:unnamed protein product [Paramecium pentaurelia]|uniref:MORN repeat protein n=1 Tax=Paramecium pentaurelia TaxID=43138 RepID=A0A8S1UFH4_9CILI|nr:unnamed protein product [Paramecium pentaurelia]